MHQIHYRRKRGVRSLSSFSSSPSTLFLLTSYSNSSSNSAISVRMHIIDAVHPGSAGDPSAIQWRRPSERRSMEAPAPRVPRRQPPLLPTRGSSATSQPCLQSQSRSQWTRNRRCGLLSCRKKRKFAPVFELFSNLHTPKWKLEQVSAAQCTDRRSYRKLY